MSGKGLRSSIAILDFGKSACKPKLDIQGIVGQFCVCIPYLLDYKPGLE